DGIGEPDDPRAGRRDHADRQIDHGDGPDIDRQIVLDVVGDADRAQPVVLAIEHEDDVLAQLAAVEQEEEQRREEDQQLADRRRQETQQRLGDGRDVDRQARLLAAFAQRRLQLLERRKSSLECLQLGKFQQHFELAVFAEWLFYMLTTTTVF